MLHTDLATAPMASALPTLMRGAALALSHAIPIRRLASWHRSLLSGGWLRRLDDGRVSCVHARQIFLPFFLGFG